MAATHLQTERLLDLALKSGMIDPKIIEVRKIVVSEWVRWKCRYGCPDYGLWLTCPPYTPTPAETRALLSEYERALMFRMTPKRGEMYKALAKLEGRVFLSGNPKALAFGGGACHLCRVCNIRSGACRKPLTARPSMEACGIDVFESTRRAGYQSTILQDKNQKFTYFGMILID